MKHRLTIQLIFLTGIFCSSVYAKTPKDSAAQVLTRLSTTFQNGGLSEMAYLDTVHNTMRSFLSGNIFFTHQELLEMLDPYRQVIWSDKKYEAHKRNYYGILCNQAQMADRGGEMLYYADKFNKLESETGERPSLTALSIIATYYEGQRSNEKLKALYEKEKAFLGSIPAIADKGGLDRTGLVQAAIVLEKSARALYELNAILSGEEAEAMLGKIAVVTQAKYKEDYNVMARIAVSQILAFYRGAIAKDNPGLIQDAFRRMDALLADENTPQYMKPYIYTTIADTKVAYYIHYTEIDSASHYLGIYEEMLKGNQNYYNRFVLKKYRARLLYTEGKFKESADTYEKAMTALDTTRSILVKDIDDMMYARAKTEEQQLLLADAAARNKRAERRLVVAITLIVFLLITGGLIINYIRRRQKNKLIAFKLNMARNIHDETNPALLYARALIRTSKSGANSVQINNQLDNHIQHTMELIRSLSHDLKSDRQYVLQDLVVRTEQTLEKLNTDNNMVIDIRANIDRKRFISHYQFSQLMSVLNECITNTIKHASFNKVNVIFSHAGKNLAITYKDDGPGWETHQTDTGIGILNMEERVRQMNGEWSIDNDYPNGYSINISVQLR